MFKNITIALAVIVAGMAMSPKFADADIGQIKTLKGNVQILREGKTASAKAGDVLEQMDTVITGGDGQVGMTFIDNTRLSAGPNSNVELTRFKFNSTTHDGAFQTSVNKGTLAIISGQIAKRSPKAMTVRTPASILGVRGTRFLVKVGEGESN